MICRQTATKVRVLCSFSTKAKKFGLFLRSLQRMKSIDIRTTQNVTISYELAEVRERLIAFVLDTLFKSVAGLILWWMAMLLFQDSIYSDDLLEYFSYVVLLPLYSFYTLFFEVIWHGQTPGKKIMKIKVIKLDGKQPEFYDYLIRWTFRILDIILSLGVIAVLLIVSSDYAQRLGDLTSNSTVVRIHNKVNITLADILRINTRQNYDPSYPGIANFPEEDILIIKQTIERYQRYRNEAHKNAVIALCETLAQKLEIQDVGSDKIRFLKTLIKDYIVLTR
jgi:uncharacterized RDD family membrane protein YckC